MRLSQPEQTYHFQLARPDLEWRQSPAAVPALPTENLLAFVEGLTPHPAYVVDGYRQVVATNTPARILLGDFDTNDAAMGSVIGRMFLDPAWRALFVDWPTVARSKVAQLRLATASTAGDPVLTSLVALLTSSSEEFAGWWNDRELAEPPIWRKTLRSKPVGDMTFDFAMLQPRGHDSDFVVSIYTPADRTSRNRLRRLLATDTIARRPTGFALSRRR